MADDLPAGVPLHILFVVEVLFPDTMSCGLETSSLWKGKGKGKLSGCLLKWDIEAISGVTTGGCMQMRLRFGANRLFTLEGDRKFVSVSMDTFSQLSFEEVS